MATATTDARTSTAPIRVALFAALLVIVFAAAYAIGTVVGDPVDTAPPAGAEPVDGGGGQGDH